MLGSLEKQLDGGMDDLGKSMGGEMTLTEMGMPLHKVPQPNLEPPALIPPPSGETYQAVQSQEAHRLAPEIHLTQVQR